ncbi:Outer membrane protein OprM precursor [Anatilimnocola aggregata]|uniref:Outer membrane protein OprM n=1 Tax=Anatilimnocola aggregata TaxID=2528021 RepID=A0A517YHS2_9BACT|nr:efflux transporter outer membrane subunit [Anatilimnocola aggregata]QDU29768.1 Outer membrane protein OprM precursor [Anatilimnocola aggregata]
MFGSNSDPQHQPKPQLARRVSLTVVTTTAALLLALTAGCRTGPMEYIHNGFKVGPNYATPGAPVSEVWIDYRNSELVTNQQAYWDWWRVFRDPQLELLVQRAHQQNLTLRQAGFRIEEARARRAVAHGNLFPQSQTAFGSYRRQQISTETGITAGGGGGLPGFERAFDVWTAGGQFSWELDFWGRFRRAVAASDAELDATVENYDDVLVVLIGDVAQTYVEIRVAQQRIRYAQANVQSQVGSLNLAKIKKEEGAASGLDVAQAVTNVSQTEATIPQLQAQLRQAENRLCILMGMPPQDLSQLLGDQTLIPEAPPQIAIGVPADLLRRRPDVRRAERLAAAQSERIGITESAMYPAFTLNGTLFVQANELQNLFTGGAVAGNVGPSFSWNLLNYGRIWNAQNAEEALFMQRVTEYQTVVLNANREAEDAIIGFLRAQQQARILRVGVDAAVESRDLINELYKGGRADFGRVFVAELFLVQQQDQLALAEGAIAANLVALYRSLGGGWELRMQDPQAPVMLPQPQNRPMEQLAPPAGNPLLLPEMLPQPDRN